MKFRIGDRVEVISTRQSMNNSMIGLKGYVIRRNVANPSYWWIMLKGVEEHFDEKNLKLIGKGKTCYDKNNREVMMI